MIISDSPLGQKTTYISTYSPELLFPVPRTLSRDKLKLGSELPFSGVDIWNAFEISWLNEKGKPEIALGEFFFPCESPMIVESKSLKLYINSLSQSCFESIEHVQKIVESDLSKIAQSQVLVDIFPLSRLKGSRLEGFFGVCLDELDITIDTYQLEPALLTTTEELVSEAVYSDLLKSNCLATGQPDWGSIHINYSGRKIDHESLLKYIISFRNHSGFAEHCAEQIFHDIMQRCQPENLSVYARYTKRGGLDINPFRSNFEKYPENRRHIRQ
jgi:7-cyano-7-deazaguanine reductase